MSKYISQKLVYPFSIFQTTRLPSVKKKTIVWSSLLWHILMFWQNINVDTPPRHRHLQIHTYEWLKSACLYGMIQGLNSLSGKVSYHKIPCSLRAASFGFKPFKRCCRNACQISERYDHYNIQSRGFETSRALAMWIEALVPRNHSLGRECYDWSAAWLAGWLNRFLWPLLLTWFNFNPSMDK